MIDLLSIIYFAHKFHFSPTNFISSLSLWSIILIIYLGLFLFCFIFFGTLQTFESWWLYSSTLGNSISFSFSFLFLLERDASQSAGLSLYSALRSHSWKSSTTYMVCQGYNWFGQLQRQRANHYTPSPAPTPRCSYLWFL